MRPWIAYTLVRLGLFTAFFAVLLLVGLPWWLAAVVAAALGFCVAYLFFRELRIRVAEELAAARSGAPQGSDEDAEDEGSDPEDPAEREHGTHS